MFSSKDYQGGFPRGVWRAKPERQEGLPLKKHFNKSSQHKPFSCESAPPPATSGLTDKTLATSDSQAAAIQSSVDSDSRYTYQDEFVI